MENNIAFPITGSMAGAGIYSTIGGVGLVGGFGGIGIGLFGMTTTGTVVGSARDSCSYWWCWCQL